MIEDVLDVLLLQPIVDSDLNRSRGSNAVDRFQEGGRVGSKNPDSSVFVLQEEVCQPSRAVSGFLVRSSEDLLVGGDMVEETCFGLDGCCAGQEDCGRELVDVVAVVV